MARLPFLHAGGRLAPFVGSGGPRLAAALDEVLLGSVYDSCRGGLLPGTCLAFTARSARILRYRGAC